MANFWSFGKSLKSQNILSNSCSFRSDQTSLRQKHRCIYEKSRQPVAQIDLSVPSANSDHCHSRHAEDAADWSDTDDALLDIAHPRAMADPGFSTERSFKQN